MHPANNFSPSFTRIQSKPSTPRFSKMSHLISLRYSLIHLRLGFPGCLWPSCFPTKIVYIFLTSHSPHISSSFTWSPYYYLIKRTGYEAPHYAVFSSLPPFSFSEVQHPVLKDNLLQGLRNRRNLSHYSWNRGRDSNPEPAEHETVLMLKIGSSV